MRRVLVVQLPLTHRYANEVRPPLQELAAQAGQQLELDLSQVDGIDATGVGMLVGTLQRARRSGSTLRIVNVPPEIQQRLVALGLWQPLVDASDRWMATRPEPLAS